MFEERTDRRDGALKRHVGVFVLGAARRTEQLKRANDEIRE